jgi:hypothetical protein
MSTSHAKAKAKADDPLEVAAGALKKSMSVTRRALREVRAAQESRDLGMPRRTVPTEHTDPEGESQ